MSIVVVVGTAKGAFILKGDSRRERWTVEGPLFKGWKVTASTRLRGSGRWLLATASDVYGPAIQASDDLVTWRQIEAGPSYPKGGTRRLNQIWRIHEGPKALYAGVDEAGLFFSEDGGESWRPVEALNEHPTRSAWQPGAGGLCAHAILTDAKNPQRLWCGISAVGVFRSEDGGKSWHAKNAGVPIIIEDKDHKDVGFCVHALAHDPVDAASIYRQDHMGMYRTRDGGDSWQKIENGLPSRFGFPLAMDPRTKALFAVPLESDEQRMTPQGKLRVYRSRNGGDSWEPLERGLPQDSAYTGVLRGAMAVDGRDPCGVYFGTISGTVHVSRDLGESWTTIPCLLPRVLSVSTFDRDSA